MAEHITTGQRGEQLAGQYLLTQGYRILGRNIANPHGKRLGEIDIVARKGKEIVFVEVKTHRAHAGGETYLPEWNVTQAKLRKLERIAEYYTKKEGWAALSSRFDVVAVTLRDGGEPEIKHIEHAFL
jgi:putative endonuclease